MVYTRRRRVVKTKRRPLMRKRRMNISRPLTQGKLYKFKRTCRLFPYFFNGTEWQQYTLNEITNSAAGQSIAGILKFRLNDLPSFTDFTSLYEQFKITGVKIKFIPYIGTESSDVLTTRTDTMAISIDRGNNDYGVVNPTFNSLLENQDVKLRNTQRPFNLWVGTPMFHHSADSFTLVAGKSGYLDSELAPSVQVDHHGVKFAFQSNVPNANSSWFRVYATYYVTCRNPQ